MAENVTKSEKKNEAMHEAMRDAMQEAKSETMPEVKKESKKDKSKRYVRVVPEVENGKLKAFNSNILPGDRLVYEQSTGHDRNSLPHIVQVVAENAFHIYVSWGSFKRCVNKSSIYCEDDLLYFLED